MKGLLKNLGLIIIILGAILLLVFHFSSNVNNNILTGGTFALMVVGLIVYIAINKKLED